MINQSLSFLIKCSQTGQVWLFNCPEGCQHILNQKRIKIHQIRHIILTNLEIDNLAGIIGLLSSLSLSCRVKTINIYGPPGLLHYLHFARKYSQTTFKYKLIIHIINHEYIDTSLSYLLYSQPVDNHKHSLLYIFLEKEKIGRFQIRKAQIYGIQPGPFYGFLKIQKKYLLPDGNIVSGKHFTHKHAKGLKLLYVPGEYTYRLPFELTSDFTHIVQ
uniref:Ribonuclease Z n=1 Tax=Liagoropsis maxima TaxID=1653392 RepID=A0A1G4NW05_9FLOR|nr:Ribonuclease Z [Liagoropsis maxima]SCW22689.1 Ribonuclease Z [Liagoropsis maxima]